MQKKSSQPTCLRMKILVFIRSMTKASIMAVRMEHAMMDPCARDSGLTKFGRTPGGGIAAGVWLKSILDGSILLLLMLVMAVSLLKLLESYFRVDGAGHKNGWTKQWVPGTTSLSKSVVEQADGHSTSWKAAR